MKKTDRVLETFAGDFIEIVTTQKISVTKGTTDDLFENASPYIVTGYLLDADSKYLYLGDTPDAVTDMVRKVKVVHIGISRPADKYEDILSEFNEPENVN